MQQHVAHCSGAPLRSLEDDTLPPVIYEGGHYYLAKGPTPWSATGWNVMCGLARKRDARMLFIDDVHPVENVHEHERHLKCINFRPTPGPTHLAAESAMLSHAHEALKVLRSLPKRRRARKIQGRWHCSGFPLEGISGRPLCLFFDLGLTWYKRLLGFDRAVNVVPEFYADEQRRLVRLAKKAMPDFELRVILHDAQGSWRWLEV
ncbi:MAG: hypothetical protein WC050_02945 [Candidatus Paceibacterota bacterium]